MNVLLWHPARSPFGGHKIQAEMTARYLSQLGSVEIRRSDAQEPDWRGAEVVHGFGLELSHVRWARRHGLPVCLSVIYCSKAFRTGLLAGERRWETALRRARMATVLSLAAVRGEHMAKCEAFSEFVIHTTALYESADLLLPNSQMEADAIRADLRVTTPLHVVPNAADPEIFVPTRPWDERDGVAYVGRIEPHKNQLALIEAMRGTGVRLTIVGGEHVDHSRYASRVRRAAAKENVELVPHVEHHELASIYGDVRVHAMPSWFETTGLASLEAALTGCNVVTTSLGYAREYFQDDAWYCDPRDAESIKVAVLAALEAPVQTRLRERILASYTWQHTAEATLAGYHALVDGRL